jgi:hypothetical protein
VEWCRTIEQLTTPFQNPDPQAAKESTEETTEIEVTDPSHPLFGRHFRVHSVSASSRRSGQVWVVYRRDILLRLPVSATQLAPPRPFTRSVKLTAAAVQELAV